MMCELDIKSYHAFRPNDNNGKPEMKNRTRMYINYLFTKLYLSRKEIQ